MPLGKTEPLPVAKMFLFVSRKDGSISLLIALSWEEIAMKLYMHPVSMTSRPVRLFIAENKIPVEEVTVDLFTGEALRTGLYGGQSEQPRADDRGRRSAPHRKLGDPEISRRQDRLARLPEGSQAACQGQRNTTDWLNTNFYRDWAYNLCYPQLFPNQKRRSEEAQAATIEIGQQNAKRWLKILNDHWIGPRTISVRQSDYDRRLFWRGSGERSARSSAAISPPIPTSSAGSTT